MLADGSEYRGHYGLDVKARWIFTVRGWLRCEGAGPDLLACETLPSLLEAQALVQLLENEFPDAQAWISFSCTDDRHISEGTALDACVAELSPCPAGAGNRPELHCTASCTVTARRSCRA